jgi:hypothetical protein
MDDLRFDALITWLATTRLTRLTALRGLAASAAALTGVGRLAEAAGAKGGHGRKKNRHEKKTRLCVCQSGDATTCTGQRKAKPKANKILKRNACAYKGTCQAGVSGCALTLSAPFTVSACWSVDADHDTVVFVPQGGFTTDPAPYTDQSCHPDDDCSLGYPFVCVAVDQQDSGCEVTTVHQQLNGTYEYWSEVETTSAAGELTVTLRDSGGNVLATWSSPANPSPYDKIGWHVFDVVDGVVVPSGVTTSFALPESAHNPTTYRCGGGV